MSAKSFYKIGVLGLWHLGSVYSAVLAELGHRVISFDVEKNGVDFFGEVLAPVKEPGLAELTEKKIASGQLVLADKIEDLAPCNIIWLAVDMPINNNGHPDFSSIENIFRNLIPVLRNGVIIVVSSQVPVGSGQALKNIISSLRPSLNFSYVYQPENLQLGRALESFFKPARVVVGAEDRKAEEVMKKIFSPLKVPVLTMDIVSSEMVKHALNSFLAVSLSFIYDIADLCKEFGADVVKVSQALKSDSRIGGDAYLDASIGFSGGTLGRDLQILLDKAANKNLEVPVLRAAALKNKKRWQIVEGILKKEVRNLKKSKIGFLGATYKPGTSTLRHSLSIEVVKALAPIIGHINIHDPLADKKEVEANTPCTFYNKIEKMAENCSVLILMTSSPEYRKLNFNKISKLMRSPKLFLDTKNFLWDHEEEIKRAGFLYRGIGRG